MEKDETLINNGWIHEYLIAFAAFENESVHLSTSYAPIISR